MALRLNNYGTLLNVKVCNKNSVVDKPGILVNCTGASVTEGAIIACDNDSDALDLLYHIEVRSEDSQVALYNYTARHPYFRLKTLHPNSTYRATLYSSNSKGRGPKVTIKLQTEAPPKVQKSSTSKLKNLYWVQCFYHIVFQKKVCALAIDILSSEQCTLGQFY